MGLETIGNELKPTEEKESLVGSDLSIEEIAAGEFLSQFENTIPTAETLPELIFFLQHRIIRGGLYGRVLSLFPCSPGLKDALRAGLLDKYFEPKAKDLKKAQEVWERTKGMRNLIIALVVGISLDYIDQQRAVKRGDIPQPKTRRPRRNRPGGSQLKAPGENLYVENREEYDFSKTEYDIRAMDNSGQSDKMNYDYLSKLNKAFVDLNVDIYMAIIQILRASIYTKYGSPLNIMTYNLFKLIKFGDEWGLVNGEKSDFGTAMFIRRGVNTMTAMVKSISRLIFDKKEWNLTREEFLKIYKTSLGIFSSLAKGDLRIRANVPHFLQERSTDTTEIYHTADFNLSDKGVLTLSNEIIKRLEALVRRQIFDVVKTNQRLRRRNPRRVTFCPALAPFGKGKKNSIHRVFERTVGLIELLNLTYKTK